MKKTILFLICFIATVIVNQIYFEYCVSRPCAEWITVVLGLVLLVYDIAMLILAVKTLKTILKL